MTLSLITLEISVAALGLALLVADLWLPAERKRWMGYGAAVGLALLFLNTFSSHCSCAQLGQSAFGGMFVQDALSVFFKRFFLLSGALVLVLATEFADRIAAGISEYYSLMVLALVGMLFAASANDFTLLFVSVELITITFYVLTSFTRARVVSLEAGVKYLILGALASAFMVFGIALVWGTTGKLNFTDLARVAGSFADNGLFVFGVVLVLAGLGFKIAAFPFQIWTPDVYQGAPTPTTAFLAVGSKAAGFALLLRFLFSAIPEVTAQWATVLAGISGVTILYGNLCALPQRDVKRLLGYSSIAHAGYMLLGAAAFAGALAEARSPGANAGAAAILFYLSGYLFSVLAAFAVVALVLRQLESEDISGLAGLNQRSPFLAAAMTLAMASLAGVPPLAGFWGKFLLIKTVVEQGGSHPLYYGLAFTALVGVVISIYYYFGVVRAMYWSETALEQTPVRLSWPGRVLVGVCVVGMFWLGLFPGAVVDLTQEAVAVLGWVQRF